MMTIEDTEFEDRLMAELREKDARIAFLEKEIMNYRKLVAARRRVEGDGFIDEFNKFEEELQEQVRAANSKPTEKV